jgi:hypothetical protein
VRVQVAQQTQEILGTSDLVIITERVDDVALLIGQMVKMGLPEVLDRHIPHHWTQRGLSWGWTAVIWLAYIFTEGDPLNLSRFVARKIWRRRAVSPHRGRTHPLQRREPLRGLLGSMATIFALLQYFGHFFERMGLTRKAIPG